MIWAAIWDSWWFFIIMGLVLVGLIGLLLFLRSKRDEDD
jgi:LPXTG-motif cell wall-anchored protein